MTAWCIAESRFARGARSLVLFGGPLADASVEDILTVFEDAPSVSVPAASLESESALLSSRSRRFGGVQGGGRTPEQTGWTLRERSTPE